MSHQSYKISCQCGATAQLVTAAGEWERNFAKAGIDHCHCNTCRHTTGVLCTSYVPISKPSNFEALKTYKSSLNVFRYFCATCGCHVFRCDETGLESSWAVATGVILERSGDAQDNSGDRESPEVEQYARHTNVEDTKDGGLSIWIPGLTRDNKITGHPQTHDHLIVDEADKELQAYCHCGTVRFHITRPDDTSRIPHSGLPDLIVPFRTGDPAIKNDIDRKWWLRPEGAGQPTHYMAGTCACKSCRLISGFEIQTWAFVPRSNIMFHLPSDPTSSGNSTSAKLESLSFTTLPPGILRTYESSPGVLRESCVKCGATVFWHDKWRPDLIDVSVGLFDAVEGARAETWLEWWKGRVSFAEDAGSGRSGVIAEGAESLIQNLSTGLKAAE